MKSKKLLLNTISPLMLQICSIVCGFILPRLILKTYGSETNGLINSITQFLQIVSFLDLGVGAVVQSSLYKPLAENDKTKINQIMTSGTRFFKRIALILLAYVVVLAFVYPLMISNSFSYGFVSLLIIMISTTSFTEYYFGAVNGILLNADKKQYIYYNIRIIIKLADAAACVLLITTGFGIHIVKLATALICLIRPIWLHFYVNNHYEINRHVNYENEPVKQKWNGIAQHVSAVVLSSTDNIVLSIFSSLSSVSVYSVYHLIISGIKNLFEALTSGIQPILGELWAKEKTTELKNTFELVEWALHSFSVLIFGCTGMLIIPFVKIYTRDITDTEYIVPAFAVLIVIAQFAHSLRMPYDILIKACGHYRQTQNYYMISAVMNIVVSVATVKLLGLVGVAIGTLCAMLFQTICMARYSLKSVLKIPLKSFVKQLIVDIISALICIATTMMFKLDDINYLSWIRLAVIIFAIWFAIILLINLMFYRKNFSALLRLIKNKT